MDGTASSDEEFGTAREDYQSECEAPSGKFFDKGFNAR